MSRLSLRGMTWSHPRGYDPLVACSALWNEKTDAEIAWDKRSLQDFESFPVEQLAQAFDLIVVDHPHVGQIVSEDCLAPLDVDDRAPERAELRAGSVGRSYSSYEWDGRQWAFPIDAAAQVQVWRPDLIDAPLKTWDEVLALAAQGKVLCPLRPPHSLMVFFTLAANLGTPCADSGPGDLIDRAGGCRVLELMRALSGALDPACLSLDPIAVYERMASADSVVGCAPLIYGYVSYAMDGFRERRLAFADLPAAGKNGPVGSALGGTGIAVSAFSNVKEAALDFAYWIAGGEIQRGPYAAAGGQPGHAAAWDDEAVNRKSGSFYRGTRATLDGSWVRPRHNGYIAFQEEASQRINQALRDHDADDRVIADLNNAFRGSFR